MSKRTDQQLGVQARSAFEAGGPCVDCGENGCKSAGGMAVENDQDQQLIDDLDHFHIPEAEDKCVFGVGISLRPGSLDVAELFPGGSAEQSCSVRVGDEIVSVEEQESISGDKARRLMRGRIGTYVTIGFRRYEGNAMRHFKLELIRGPPEYISLLSLCSKLERQNEQTTIMMAKLRASTNAPEQPSPQQYRSAGSSDAMLEEYKDRLALAEDEIIDLRRKEQDHKAMADRLSLVEKELRESEDQRRRQKSELSAMQDMVNSSTYHRERITELEQQLAETKQRSEDDRKALREQVSLKEEAILRQVQRISELEMIAAEEMSKPAAEKEIVRLRSILASKENQLRTLEMQLGPSQGRNFYAHSHIVTVPTHTSVVTSPVGPSVGASPSNLPISATPPPLTTIQKPHIVMGITSEYSGRASPSFNHVGQGVASYNLRSIHSSPPISHTVPATPLGNNFWGSEVPSPFPSGASSPYIKPQAVPTHTIVPGQTEANF